MLDCFAIPSRHTCFSLSLSLSLASQSWLLSRDLKNTEQYLHKYVILHGVYVADAPEYL